ncbi:Lysozyme C, milk isozyme [Portunus trituberculatus]|uniref:lysozyme n=1 Tax=Portunus trituberculatus TaxID=210409 RepID=A0A5B7E1E3_PORTR|nr:Lysozyme C, milk isozyme [Portunus trituberculatus]
MATPTCSARGQRRQRLPRMYNGGLGSSAVKWSARRCYGVSSILTHGSYMAEAVVQAYPTPGVCIAQYESTFNTKAHNKQNSDGSQDYGLFQLNNKYWCGNTHKNECNMPCEALLDEDITDDVRCMKKIIRETEKWKGKGTGLTA